jgi:hypothetical protein
MPREVQSYLNESKRETIEDHRLFVPTAVDLSFDRKPLRNSALSWSKSKSTQVGLEPLLLSYRFPSAWGSNRTPEINRVRQEYSTIIRAKDNENHSIRSPVE